MFGNQNYVPPVPGQMQTANAPAMPGAPQQLAGGAPAAPPVMFHMPGERKNPSPMPNMLQQQGGQQPLPAQAAPPPGVAQALAGGSMAPVASPIEGAANAASTMLQAYQTPQGQAGPLGSILGAQPKFPVAPSMQGGGLY